MPATKKSNSERIEESGLLTSFVNLGGWDCQFAASSWGSSSYALALFQATCSHQRGQLVTGPPLPFVTTAKPYLGEPSTIYDQS